MKTIICCKLANIVQRTILTNENLFNLFDISLLEIDGQEAALQVTDNVPNLNIIYMKQWQPYCVAVSMVLDILVFISDLP